MSRWCFLIGTMVTLMLGQPSAAEDFLTGTELYADVARYASFGSHRFGSPGDRATTDWIAGELQTAGFAVEFQPIVPRPAICGRPRHRRGGWHNG